MVKLSANLFVVSFRGSVVLVRELRLACCVLPKEKKRVSCTSIQFKGPDILQMTS